MQVELKEIIPTAFIQIDRHFHYLTHLLLAKR